MRNYSIMIVCLFLGYTHMFSQNIRTYDGTGNNISNPTWGSTSANLLRMIPAAYSDGISAMTGVNRPNPRFISNQLFDQNSLIDDPLELSNFVWVYGQFIDHDISITPDQQGEFAMIPVPAGDPSFDPFNTGTVMIPMSRSAFDPTTGISSPREHINHITAFVDGSGVYGSDQTRADWLRSFQGGKLKVSTQNLLPFNTFDNEANGQHDSNAPEMDDAVGFSPSLFVAGDVRANENILLASFHTLFVREHNRICDELAINNPSLSDEQLYQKARRIVSGIIQNITFNEWLPAMGIELTAYQGYQPNVNAGITNLFSGAAFRLGHTLLTSDITRLDNDGQVIPEGNIQLLDAFFQPHRIPDEGGIDPLFKGMAQQIQQDFDCKVIDDVRNFLFGPPGAGGLDLAAININRGRERGLPDYNTVRASVGIGAATNWSDINTDPNFASLMESVYGDINDIDPWVGFLAEEHMPGALFGPTVMEIMRDQFQRLRDGDRFYFMVDPGLTVADRVAIANTNMADVVRRNTGIAIMQENLFKSLPHADVANCNATSATADIDVEVKTAKGVRIQNVDLSFVDGASQNNIQYDLMSNGQYSINDLPTCYDYNVSLSKQDDYRNGISTYDIILIQSHLLQYNNYVMSPYLQLAGDVDNSGSLDIFDMLILRQLLLGIIDDFPLVDPWRFYPANIVFTDPTDPFTTAINSDVSVELLNADQEIDFVGLKAGDVSANARVNAQTPVEQRNAQPKIFQTKDQEFNNGENLVVPVFAEDLQDLAGFQFTLDYDNEVLKFVKITSENLPSFGEGNYSSNTELGTILTSWTGQVKEETIEPIFNVHFKAIGKGELSKHLSMSSNVLTSEAYTSTNGIADLSLTISGKTVNNTSFEVSAARPNPFKYETTIDIKMPTDGSAAIYISNSFGQQVYTQRLDLTEGLNQLVLEHSALGSTGTYFYMIETEHGVKQGRVIMIY